MTKLKISVVFIIICVILLGSSGFAQEGKESSNGDNKDNSKSCLSGILDWFKSNSFLIRKTFDGSSNEGKPASIYWINKKNGDKESFYAVDVAIKIGEFDILPKSESTLFIYPVIEWHKLSQEENPKDRLSGSIKLEYRPLPLKTYKPDGSLRDPIYPGQKRSTVSPLFIGVVSYAKDFENKDKSVKASLLASITSNKKWLPGAAFLNKYGGFYGRYYIYLGYEYYNPLSNDLGGDMGFALARFYFEFWPITIRLKQYLQLVIDYTLRNKVQGSIPGISYADDLAVSVNYYPDGKEHIAIGYEFLYGEDSRDVFRFRNQSSIGLRIKF